MSAWVPFFQGSLDQVKELQRLCEARGVATQPVPPRVSGNT